MRRRQLPIRKKCARRARTASNVRAKAAIPPDQIMISPLDSKVNPRVTQVSASECRRKESLSLCVVDDEFRPMTVLTNGRLVCENCGHTSFPEDEAFKCPCSKCLKLSVWYNPTIRRP